MEVVTLWDFQGEIRLETRERKEVQNTVMERLFAPLDTVWETTENLTVEVHDGKKKPFCCTQAGSEPAKG